MKNSVWIVLIAFVIMVAGTVTAADAPASKTYKSKKGDVTFNHAEHVKRAGAKKCNVCHHTAKADGSDVKACGTCHKAKDETKDGKKVMSSKNAFHKSCKACHKKDKSKKAPTKCKDCHIKK